MSCNIAVADGVKVHSSSGDATVNPCTLCAPLGAVLATVGVQGAVPLLHGAQGCATYIRRYLISHFREPMDIASSSFGEAQTVFGGEDNLGRALDNITQQYQPELVAIATTCVAETIGEDVPRLVRRHQEKRASSLPVVTASTPSYKDGHVEGFHTMVFSMVNQLATESGERLRRLNLLPPLVSPADLRHLSEIVESFSVKATLLPNYADTLDGVIQDHYQIMPDGGTPLAEVRAMPRSLGTLDLTLTGRAPRASGVLAERGAPAEILGLPIGVRATDRFVEAVESLTGERAPSWLVAERGRLLDAYADGHKAVFGRRVAVFGDPELVAALTAWLLEIGAKPVLCATGARNRALSPALSGLGVSGIDEILEDTDFSAIEAACRRTQAEVLLGSSKAYRLSRAVGASLIRVGFPIHDRIGAGRLLHLGYRGTVRLFDALVNTVLERQQEASPIGFSYL